MAAMDSVKARIDELECIVKLQMAKIDELSAENERLKVGFGLDAHSTLQAIYRDESAPRSDRIKAANGAIGYEQPKMGSILPSLGSVNRAERWRVFECGHSDGSTSSSTAIFHHPTGMRICSLMFIRRRRAMPCRRST
jgi:hypothetical protein